ncbi:MAG: T9SS type A sorting domain-containing protein [Sphingobacteriales bacterium]|nr:MAG: T9SS type A sorting domain-containing protein [Sphingobacteriales bacterium]
MKKTLLLTLFALLFMGISGVAQAQCTAYAGGPYSDQGIDVAGCNGNTLNAPYGAWLNEVYFTEVVSGGNYTFSFCDGYNSATWGEEAIITAILNGTPSGAPPGTIDGGTLLGSELGCTFTFDATEDGTVFFILSTASACGGDILQTENGVPSITTNSGVECSTECSTTPVFATFTPAGQPAISPTPTIFCHSFFTEEEVPVGYVSVAVFPGDGTLYTFTNEDGFMFYGLTADGFIESTEFEPGFIGFMLVTDELIAAAGGTTTIEFTSGEFCYESLTIDWATDFPGLVVADLCSGGSASTPGADECADALQISISDGAINGPYSNVAATGEAATPPDCFGDDDGTTGENFFDNSVWFVFVGDGSTITLTTSVLGAPAPMPNADTQMAIFIGSCNELVEIACNDDIDLVGENYLSSITLETFPGENYYVVVDGYYYTNGPDSGDFFINVSAEGGSDCLAEAGILTPPAVTTICQDGTIDAFTISGDNTDAAYFSIIVVTSGAELTILGYVQPGTAVDLTGLPAGDYMFHAFNFLVDDAETIDDAVAGGATGLDIAGLIDDGTICADLDVAGIPVTILPPGDPLCSPFVCEANFGTTSFGNTVVCEGTMSEEVLVSGDNTDGYSTLLVITQGTELTIVSVVGQGSIDFAGLAPGNYTVHAFNFLDTDLPAIVEAIETGAVTTGFDVAALIVEGLICAALDEVGVVFTVLPADDPACVVFVCEANYGEVNFGSTTLCEGSSSEEVFVTGDNTDGYSTALVITSGAELTIVDVVGQGTIDFSGYAPGDYTVHAFNYLDTDFEAILEAIQTGTVTTGGEVASLIVEGLICAALDVDGVVFTILPVGDPACTPFVCEANFGEVSFGSTSVCEGGSSDPIFVTGDNTEGYSTLLVITQGAELTILNVVGQGSIDFAGYAPGDYTIHAFNYLDTDLPAILEALETGAVTTGGEVASLIVEGLICAALDVDGVTLTVLPITDALCQSPPVAGSDLFVIAPNTESFVIQLSGYVSDANGDPLTIAIGSPDQGGTASFDDATGELTFFPDAGFFGTVVIPYTVTDGFSEPVSGTMTIVVELSCDSLNPISIGIIEIVTNPVSGVSVAYLSVNGGLPEFDGSNYTINIYESEGVVLFSANDVPTGSVYTVPALSTENDAVTLVVTDNLGCTNEFEVFVIGTTLPVQLVDFKGTVQERGNLIEWVTSSETNNDFYTLYRSTDAVNYQKIAQVDGKGTTSLSSNYQYFDENAPNGVVYYQLVQTNFDGTNTTLGTIALNRTANGLTVVQVAPVPASHSVNLVFATQTVAKVQISLFDLSGKLVTTQFADATDGINNVQIDVADIPAGMYLLTINDGTQIANAKIVKE